MNSIGVLTSYITFFVVVLLLTMPMCFDPHPQALGRVEEKRKTRKEKAETIDKTSATSM